MKTNAYREYLRGHGLDDEKIEERIPVILAFEDWLSKRGMEIASADQADVGDYAKHLIAVGENTLRNYYTLCNYAMWLGLRALYVQLVEVTDCHNGMETLRDIIETRHGAEIRDQIFREPIPPLGADEAERFAYTQTISGRMDEYLTPKEIHAAWFQVQHGMPKEFWQKHDDEQRQKYAACESLEEFVDRMVEERHALLTRLHAENELWFTQEVTDEALDYLLEHPHLQLGEHNGRKGILVTKVPYQTARSLRETDKTLKRYYACHCPLVREAILKGKKLSGDSCYCSLGHASHYLTGMGLEHLEGEVLESVVRGDDRCRFIFYLPENA